MPLGTAGRRDQHRHAGEGFLWQHVEERLEQPAVGRVERRAHGDHPIGVTDRLERRFQLRGGESRQHCIGDRAGKGPQLDHRHARRQIPVGQRSLDGRGQPVGQQPG
jgi:hypothetical protein